MESTKELLPPKDFRYPEPMNEIEQEDINQLKNDPFFLENKLELHVLI